MVVDQNNDIYNNQHNSYSEATTSQVPPTNQYPINYPNPDQISSQLGIHLQQQHQQQLEAQQQFQAQQQLQAQQQQLHAQQLEQQRQKGNYNQH